MRVDEDSDVYKALVEEYKLKNHQIRQLALIDFRLYWYGRCTRSNLINGLDTNESAAKYSFSTFNKRLIGEILPKLRGKAIPLKRDTSRGGYVADFQYEPVLIQPDAGDFLSDLARQHGIVSPYIGETQATKSSSARQVTELPVQGIRELARRPIKIDILRAVVWAIIKHYQLDITYTDANGEERRLEIEPHTLTNDTFRWAVRARQSRTDDYADFVIDRIKSANILGGAHVRNAKPDNIWQKTVKIELCPHPDLGLPQRQHIIEQYGMKHQKIVVEMPGCFAPYFLKRYQLEEESKAKAPHQQPLFVKNRDEVTKAIPPRMRIPPEKE